jgi:hypothetical protein
MSTRTAVRRGFRGRRRTVRVPIAQLPLWGADEASDRAWRPLDRSTRDCGRQGVAQAREALEHSHDG